MKRKKSKSIKNSAGFTLIEVLLVVSIISLLSSIVITSTVSARKKARDTVRRQTLKTIATALEMYYSDFGSYPTTTSTGILDPASGNYLPSNFSSDPNDAFGTGANSDNFIAGLVPKYLSSFPRDPLGGNAPEVDVGVCGPGLWKRAYIYKSNGIDYKFMAQCIPETSVLPSDSLIDPLRDGGPLPTGTDKFDPTKCDSGSGKTDYATGDGSHVFALAVYSSSNAKCW